MNVLLPFLVVLFDKLTSTCKWGFIFLSIAELFVLGTGEILTSGLLILTVLFAILVTICKLFVIILIRQDNNT